MGREQSQKDGKGHAAIQGPGRACPPPSTQPGMQRGWGPGSRWGEQKLGRVRREVTGNPKERAGVGGLSFPEKFGNWGVVQNCVFERLIW